MYGMCTTATLSTMLCLFTKARLLDNLSALTALLTALEDLDSLCATVGEAYDTSLGSGEYEKWQEES